MLTIGAKALSTGVLLVAASLAAAQEIIPSVQAYTFNRFTAAEAIRKTSEAGSRHVELFPGQRLSDEMPDVRVGPGMGEEATKHLEEHLKKNNVAAIAFGVTGIPTDEAAARSIFSWAKRLGISVINTESVNALDTIEKMVKEFDIKVGFHNHPSRPDDPNYRVWDPAYVLSIIKDRDRRIGACADTGHWVRSGIKPIDALKILEGRIVSSHLKDLNEFSRRGHDVPYGQGVSDIPAILAELRRQGFTGPVSVEYEHNWDNSLPEVAQCIGFVRGFLAR
jgi:sugar phosphate isomerase/epimerase